MKKIISIFLCICISLLCCNIVFARQAVKSRDKTVEMGLLKAVGIIENIPGEVDGNKELTRAEFAVLTAKIMGIQSYESDVRYFVDVPMDHWAITQINILVECGVISLSSDNFFRPNDKITIDEAVKFLVCACGYSDYAMVLGGYPKGYSEIARQLEFCVTGGVENITKTQAYELVYNALHAPIYKKVSSDGFYNKYENTEETLLSEVFDIYFYEGVITQANGICIYGETVTQCDDTAIENIVCIYENIYKSDMDLYNYLGRRTKIYYQQENEDSIPQIIYREDYKKSDEVIDVLADDIHNVEKGIITYYDGSKTKRITIPTGAVVVKNGENLKERLDSDFDIDKGDIRIIDIENDGIVDVVIISEYENIIADNVLADEGLVYDKIIKERNISLDDTRIVFITDEAGVQKSITDIKRGDCISVYESEEYVRAVINPAGTTANIYSMSEQDGKIVLELGKSELDKACYEIDEVFYNEYLLGKYYTALDGSIRYTGDIDLTPGKTITYYKDIEGKIAYIDVTLSGEWKYGYLVENMYNEDDDKMVLKIFDQSEMMNKFICNEKIKVDGILMKSYEDIKVSLIKNSVLAVGEDKINGQIIRYKLNGENEITDIDTQKVNSEAEGRFSLNYTGKGENLEYWYHTSSFPGGKFFYSGNTIKFVVPEPEKLSEASEEDFYIMKGNFSDNIKYTFDTYRLDIKGINEDIFVIYGSSAATRRGPYLVESIYKILDTDTGDIVYHAELYNMINCDKVSVSAKSGYDFSFTGKNSLNQDELYFLGKGDITMMNVDVKGKVESLTVYYDYSRRDDESYKVQTGWKTTTGPRQHEATDLLYANVKDIRDGVYRLVYGKDLSEEDLYEENYTNQSWATRSDIAKTLIFDGDFITEGTAANILPATVTGALDSQKYWFTVTVGRIKSAVIYE